MPGPEKAANLGNGERVMPVRWDIRHSEKLVHIVAEGPVTAKDLEEHFDALAVAGAMGYAKLFDARRAVPVYSDHDVLMMGARLSAYTATLPTGPLAVVGDGDTVAGAFLRFVNMSPAKRPARLFATEQQARDWLATQSHAVNAPPPPQPPRA